MHTAASTIIAKNYLPFAKVLGKTYLRHHPDRFFFVLIIDESIEEIENENEHFIAINVNELDLPFGDLFLYQYSILELSTAVKPFLLTHLLTKYKLENILYLDPDLYVTRPLTSVYEALEKFSIVLTPHMFLPPPDDARTPRESDIMLSGVYNLGFLGIRNDKTTHDLLTWWSERLATKCVIDPPNALFVDQRWMDLAPAYFDGVCILRDPTLNVAYWNLHERKLEQIDNTYCVNKHPLSFFHFSGFNPNDFSTLSKHQNRHKPSDTPALEAICKEYSKELFTNDYLQLSILPYCFSQLSNGVILGKLTQWTIRNAIRLHLDVPSPKHHPDNFCRFLMTPNRHFDKRGIAPILTAIEHYRADVKAAFPESFASCSDASGIRQWVGNSGGEEEGLSVLFMKFGKLLDRADVTQHAVNCWKRREDLRKAFPEAFSTKAGSELYSNWIERHGTSEEGFMSGDATVFLERRKGLIRVLLLWLQDVNLQREFKFPFLNKDRNNFIAWLHHEACPRDIVAPEDVAWFEGFALASPEPLAEIILGYSNWLHANMVGGGTVFDMRQLYDMLSEYDIFASDILLIRLYTSSLGYSLLAQAEQFYYYNTATIREEFPEVFPIKQGSEQYIISLCEALLRQPIRTTGCRSLTTTTNHPQDNSNSLLKRMKTILKAGRQEQPNENAPFSIVCDKLIKELAELNAKGIGINLAGYFHSPTGMGESARSMARTLIAGNIRFKEIPLPTTHIGPWLDIDDLCTGKIVSSHDTSSSINLIIANGDDYPQVRSKLPYAFWQNRKNIGYWVWETEDLPETHTDHKGLAEIWTPSEYSANAIRKKVSVTVRVVPHILDFDEVSDISANRAKYQIPDNCVAYGYFFDCKSVVERKNPLALIKAFRSAFGSTRNALLVIKASSPEYANREFMQLKHASEGLNVIWITDILTRNDTLTLMKSLDVYVSLHRSEGFGLTIAEAMAMEKPVIATNYSGNTDFMTNHNSCLVRTKVIETSQPFGPYPAGTHWGEPDIDHAAELLVKMQDPLSRKAIGEMALKSIHGKLNAYKIGQLSRKYISAILES